MTTLREKLRLTMDYRFGKGWDRDQVIEATLDRLFEELPHLNAAALLLTAPEGEGAGLREDDAEKWSVASGFPHTAESSAAWMDSAAVFSRNADFYRGIVVQIGEMFGDAAKTSDDGSLQDSVLALKVPGLVAALTKQPAAQEPAAAGVAERESEIEELAKHLHKERGYDRYRTWPTHADDEGYRGNGRHVTITPPDVQARLREEAGRILIRVDQLRRLTLTPAAPKTPDAATGGSVGDGGLREAIARVLDPGAWLWRDYLVDCGTRQKGASKYGQCYASAYYAGCRTGDDFDKYCRGMWPGYEHIAVSAGRLNTSLKKADDLLAGPLARCLAQPAPVGEDETGVRGWIAPDEPTPEMERAFDTAYWAKAGDASSPTPTEHPDDGGGAFGYGYRAMRKAAALSTAPAARPGDEVERVRHVKRVTDNGARALGLDVEALINGDDNDRHGHTVRPSDSSLYDVKCTRCGGTDASGDQRLDQPCVPAAAPAADGGRA